jgi:hypothetical protein
MNYFQLPLIIGFASLSFFLLVVDPSQAISPIVEDPRGFKGIKWGTNLHTLKHLTLVDPDDRIQAYQFKEDSLQFADTKVETLRLLTIDGKFARVMIRYHGEEAHQAIIKYLSAQYGEIQHRPGSMIRGLNQENTWRGNDTEISINYRGHGEQGFIQIQSRILAPRFLEMISDHSH